MKTIVLSLLSIALLILNSCAFRIEGGVVATGGYNNGGGYRPQMPQQCQLPPRQQRGRRQMPPPGYNNGGGYRPQMPQQCQLPPRQQRGRRQMPPPGYQNGGNQYHRGGGHVVPNTGGITYY